MYCSVLFLASIFLKIAQVKFSGSSATGSYGKVRQGGALKDEFSSDPLSFSSVCSTHVLWRGNFEGLAWCSQELFSN